MFIIFASVRHNKYVMRLDFDKLVLKKLLTIKIGDTISIGKLAPKDPDGFSDGVKRLIRSGWCEYEFSNDYSAIRRLDLPDFASDHFKTLRNEHSKLHKSNQAATCRSYW